jgi:hypothetical protein
MPSDHGAGNRLILRDDPRDACYLFLPRLMVVVVAWATVVVVVDDDVLVVVVMRELVVVVDVDAAMRAATWVRTSGSVA